LGWVGQDNLVEILKHVIKVDFWDIDKMANAIYSILKYPALTETIKKNGENEANHLKWDESAKKVYSVYQQAISNL